MMRRVLVVDENEIVRSVIARALSQWGFEALTVSRGERAYSVLEERNIDAVLFDPTMPLLAGTAVYHAIVNRWPGLRGRVVIMTSDPHADHLRDWIEEEGCPLLRKPFTLGELRAAVEAVTRFDRHQAGTS